MNSLLAFLCACAILTSPIKLDTHLYLQHCVLAVFVALNLAYVIIRGRLSSHIFNKWNILGLVLVATSVLPGLLRMPINLQTTQIIQLALFYTFLQIGLILQPSTTKIIHQFLFSALIINAAFGAIQSINWIREKGFVLFSGQDWFRVKGLAVSPADYVSLLMLGLALSQCVMHSRLMRRAAALVFIGLLVISMSRSGIVVAILFAVLATRNVLLSGQWLKIIIILFAIPVIINHLGDNLIIDRISAITNIDWNIRRFVVFSDVITKVSASPGSFVFGNGYGTYSFFHPIDLEVYDNPHNMYLAMLYGGGIIGLIGHLTLMFSLLKIRRGRCVLSENANQRALFGDMGAFVWLCITVVGLVETNLLWVSAGWVTAIVIGSLISDNGADNIKTSKTHQPR